MATFALMSIAQSSRKNMATCPVKAIRPVNLLDKRTLRWLLRCYFTGGVEWPYGGVGVIELRPVGVRLAIGLQHGVEEHEDEEERDLDDALVDERDQAREEQLCTREPTAASMA